MGSDAQPPPAARPIAADQRLVALDLIRGIAVLGILLANITAFAHPELAYYWPGALPGGGNLADGWVWLVQFVAIDGKLRALFTLLFGAGLVIFVERLGGDERAMVIQARRLAWLLVFGVLHFTLLFVGDILFSYACAGLMCLAALRLVGNNVAGEKLVALGLVWLVVAGVFTVLAYLTPALVEAGGSADALADPSAQTAAGYYAEFWQGQLDEAAAVTQVMQHGSYADIVRYRLVEQGHMLASYVRWCFFETIPLILLGMGLYRCGLFAPADGKAGHARPGWLAWAWGGVALGLALNLASGLLVMQRGFPPYLTQAVFFGTSSLTNLPLILGGMALLARWARRPRDSWLADRLVLAGRMAFSNYIATSVLMVLLFHGWAGGWHVGWFGQLHRLDMALAVVLGWAMMLSMSRLWLARFRYGPLEWVWRCLTYWRLFPNRLPMV